MAIGYAAHPLLVSRFHPAAIIDPQSTLANFFKNHPFKSFHINWPQLSQTTLW